MQKRRAVVEPEVSAFLLVLVAVVAPGCFQGTMIVPEPGASSCSASRDCDLGRVCNVETGYCVPSRGPCSPDYPDGDCPRGTECRAGVCVSCEVSGDCPETWCECPLDQGCENGVCVPIEPENSCAPERPNGACTEGRECCGGACCPAGEVCVGGTHCVPNVRPCGPAEPDGYCRDGLACFEGRCVPLDVCLCSSDRLLGCCPNGQDCLDGVCTNVACAPEEAGSCPIDFVCIDGTCDQLACAPGHPNGECDSSKYCSDIGACIDPGTCGVNSDCLGAEFCSTTTVCLLRGTCASDGDCEAGQVEDYGQGFECDNGSCLPRETCAAATDCIPGTFCSVGGHCLASPNCDGDGDCGTGEYCSAIGQCVSTAVCRSDLDCRRNVQNRFCAGDARCYDIGQCFATTDCPPNEECIRPGAEIGTCTVPGAAEACDSNVFATTGCAPVGSPPETPLVCCGSGNCCDDLKERCSAHNHCIPAGACVDDSDCIAGYTVCSDFLCIPSPQKPCPCGAGERCGQAKDATGVWVSGCIPDDRCAATEDCDIGEYCDPTFVCRPNAACGHDFLEAGSIIRPNVLIVIDRSGSMQLCGAGDPAKGFCGYNDGNSCAEGDACSSPAGWFCFDGSGCSAPDCNTGQNPADVVTRWDQARQAIQGVTDEFQNWIDFGLSIYPKPPADRASYSCPTNCNAFSCTNFSNLSAGVVDLPVGPGNIAEIVTQLDPQDPSGTVPGGSTPTASTLRNVVSAPGRGGLNDPTKYNAVLLVTDGEATPSEASGNAGYCMPPCSDGTKNGDETGQDCGGSCNPCAAGTACLSDEDCESRLCRTNLCRASSCSDGTKNGDETGQDCGGSCGPCSDGTECSGNSDCTSGVCNSTSHQCAPPSCSDSVKNGDETDVNCGGSCATKCLQGDDCFANIDCATNACQAGTCRLATCNNAGQDLVETDVDCGGTDCGPCATGDSCGADGDCLSGWCDGGTCAVRACENGQKDGAETDIDCGGGTCPDCGPYHGCAGSADCAAGAVCQTYDLQNTAVQGTLVNLAVGRLYSAAPRVRTFVVGFNLGATSANLNCHAVYGRTARTDVPECAQLTTADCGTASAACYQKADDPTALNAALRDILDQVSACSYNMSGQVFPNPQAVYVYLESKTTPGARTRVERYVDWDIISNPTKQLEFYGAACNQLKRELVSPVVVLGCASGGG